jgi:hypothetical protein
VPVKSLTPSPPHAEGTGVPWDVTVDDAVAAIAEARARHGDTFVVDSGDDRYLFTLSPPAARRSALPEEKASKGVADYLMLRRKLPDEIFDGSRTLPGSLFRRGDVSSYPDNVDRAPDHTVAEIGSQGTADVFRMTHRLGHRMGAALDDVTGVIESAVRQWDSDQVTGGDLFGRIVDAWSSELWDVRIRGISLDVALIHIASMSNLMAALGWAMVSLIEHPAELDAVARGDVTYTVPPDGPSPPCCRC